MRLPALTLVALAFVTLGCGRIREVKGCRSLAALVNPVLDEIEAKVEKDQGPAAYRYAATRYAKVGTELKKFDIGIPRSEKAVDDLGAALEEASVQSVKLATALEQRDVVVAATVRRELGQLARLQKAIVSRIGQDCD